MTSATGNSPTSLCLASRTLALWWENETFEDDDDKKRGESEGRHKNTVGLSEPISVWFHTVARRLENEVDWRKGWQLVAWEEGAIQYIILEEVHLQATRGIRCNTLMNKYIFGLKWIINVPEEMMHRIGRCRSIQWIWAPQFDKHYCTCLWIYPAILSLSRPCIESLHEWLIHRTFSPHLTYRVVGSFMASWHFPALRQAHSYMYDWCYANKDILCPSSSLPKSTFSILLHRKWYKTLTTINNMIIVRPI